MQKKVHRKLNKKALLVIVLTLYLFIMAFYYCFNLPIKSIVIKGNTNTLDEEIIKLGNINSYNKILGLNTKKVKNDIMENKAITSVKIKKQLNGTLLIDVKEQNILFYNLLNKVYVYENGKTSENVSNKLGIPTLINYTPSDIYDNLIKKLNNINIDILKKVSEIEYSPDIKNEKVIDKNRFLLRMNDGNYIYINLANMDNLNKYEEIYATLDEKQKGILNLDSTSKGVVFQPFDLIKEKEEKKMNYQNELDKLIKKLDYKPTLLLHSCCGPCSTQVLTYLCPFFNITVLYYNPNIEPIEEYIKRKNEQIRFIKEFNHDNIKFLDCDYDNETFRNKTKGLENEKEGKARCPVCFRLRLEYTAKKAKELNYDYFGTTLTVSPYKNSRQINILGGIIGEKYNIKYLFSDFKKGEGYKKSIEYSKEYNLYRQDYCGCLYAKSLEMKKNN